MSVIATNPKRSVAYIYLALAILILIALGSIMVVGVRKHNLKHILYAIGLIALMVFLFWLMALFFGPIHIL